MGKIRITKLFHFEMAHALNGHDGLCANIHGHSYKLQVTIVGVPVDNCKSPKNGMLIDFSDLKRIVKESVIDRYDHALVLNNTTDNTILSVLQKHYNKIIMVDYQPTTEQMLIDFAKMLQKSFPPEISLYSLRLSETETSYAEWFVEDE
ncbi:MAG: 6-carboxytetrahydropterin synthase [Bacteroidales bacterium]|jgi:6-pyruvoyltetrahydropterin/6-carboxytetrahydropterin synthase|nr:6-carboxytetrahydropterin synthase [Bacteroidales bacterium]